MYAIVEASGRQIQLEAGRFVDVDLVSAEPGQSFQFDRVLMIVNGKESQVGKPTIEGAVVKGRVLEHGRGAKILVYKQRPKKGTRKKQGHRQGYTRIVVDSIELNGKVLAEAKAGKPVKKAEAQPEAKPQAKKEAPKAKAESEAKPAKKAEAKAAAPKPAAKTGEKKTKPAEKKA